SIVFSAPVSGVSKSDFRLTKDGIGVSLGGQNATLSGSGANYTLNLSKVTATQGHYVLTLVAAGSGIVDSLNNALQADAQDDWIVDTTAPTADIVDVIPDPRTIPVGNVSVTFSESVIGVDVGDFTLTCNGAAVSLAGVAVAGSGSSYSLN